ncbi:MAG: hypothetical protein WA277_04595 [Nitrospirota bacterium]|jgi:hypothetical protein
MKKVIVIFSILFILMSVSYVWPSLVFTAEITKSDELINYLYKEVPELNKLANEIEKKSKGAVRLIIYVAGEPNKNSQNRYDREYYAMYVGENHKTHNVNIYWLLIHKDTKEILFHDIAEEEYIPLKVWRSRNKK